MLLNLAIICRIYKRNIKSVCQSYLRTFIFWDTLMPVLHSKSPSSCITSILEPLHHTCPIIHAWGFCCNSHKSEVWQSCFLGCWTQRMEQPSCFSSPLHICCPI